GIAGAEADVEGHVATFLEAELAQAGLEALDGRMGGGKRLREDADHARAVASLRRRRRRSQTCQGSGDGREACVPATRLVAKRNVHRHRGWGVVGQPAISRW